MYTTVDMRALQDRLDAITTPVAEEVAVEAVELSAEPLTHNPEATTKRELNTYSQNRTRTTFDSVLNKISNFK